jgi:uncharacterized repeat protein (TIGR03803 family)
MKRWRINRMIIMPAIVRNESQVTLSYYSNIMKLKCRLPVVAAIGQPVSRIHNPGQRQLPSFSQTKTMKTSLYSTSSWKRQGGVLLGIAALLTLCGQSAVYAQLSASDIAAMKQEIAKQKYTFTVDENPATKIPLSQLCGTIPSLAPKSTNSLSSKTMLGEPALPSYWDWRQHNGVTPVKNQGNCGSCWAFSTVGTMEAMILITSGTTTDLSEQQLVSCNTSGWSCDGGNYAFDMEISPGAMLESCFPYQAANVACQSGCPYAYHLSSWGYVGNSSSVPSTTAIKNAIYTYGPISVCVAVDNYFQGYSGGVFNNNSATSIDHAVVLVGWDDANGCWIMKNSWGTGWGESGYMRIAYGCDQIGYSAAYAVWELPEPLRIMPGTNFTFTGPVGGPFSPTVQIYSLTNHISLPLNWSLANTSLWLNVSPDGGTLTGGGPATTVTLSMSETASNLPPGSYTATLQFTNLTDQFGQSRQVTLAVVTPPVITTQPTNLVLFEGATATFTVGISSNALLFYQWQQDNGSYLTNLTDGGNISGSVTSTLTISNASAANVGAYSVTVTNAAGTVTSASAFLTIIPWRPVITLQPTSQTLLPGATATFTVAAVGTHPLSYQWRLGGTNLTQGSIVSDSATSSLTVSNVSSADAGTYTVIISNALGSATSTNAVLSVVSVTAPGTTLTTLSSFTGTGTSGEYPYCPLIKTSDGNFYGTTLEGGTYGYGTVFRVTTNGTLFTRHSFSYSSDGAFLYDGLVQGQDGNLYGTTLEGSTYGYGTVFRITTHGVLTTLASFNGTDGHYSFGGLVQGTDGNFYGTTEEGGSFGYGNVFKVSPSGVLTNLHSFNLTNGGYPLCALIQGTDGNFYGTTETGGATGWGTVFKITPSGQFTTLASFDGLDGGIPVAGLVQDADGSFYGTTYYGGTNYSGSIFRMTPDGTLTNLYSFTGVSDGSQPFGGLTLGTDGNFYGTTENGGDYGVGTVFKIGHNGTLTTLATFDGYQGANPEAAPVEGTDGNFYGTTRLGGVNNRGTVYRLSGSLPPSILVPPTNQTVFAGVDVTFAVVAAGTIPLSYQWQENGTNLTDVGSLSGSATSVLTIHSTTTANSGTYSVILSNAFGSVTSTGAVLTVTLTAPVITMPPTNQTVLPGATVTFTAAAVGSIPLFYQWQDNGTNITDGGSFSGATTMALTISPVLSTNAGTYSVVVSNAAGFVTSTGAVLTVLPITPPGFTLNSLRSFNCNSDGCNLNGLVQGADGNFYGTAAGGGDYSVGTVFKMTTNGTLTTLYTFTGGADGAYPYAALVQGTNGNFYGTTVGGGDYGSGTVFKMTTNGTLTTLYSFTYGDDGANPYDSLVQGADGNFYGTARSGGPYIIAGTIFMITADGILTPLHSFTGGDDGLYPWAGLIQGADGNFYGTTYYGGVYGGGTVFELATDGTLTPLVQFNSTNGANPLGNLVQGVDGSIYGTTFYGGTNGNNGTVFRLTTNGTLTTLYQFSGNDGANPCSGLIQGSDGNLYGTTSQGGLGGDGTVFQITANGILNTLVWFDWSNGANPEAPLTQALDGSFYGTTYYGGVYGNGVVFQLILPVLPPAFRTISNTHGTFTLTWSATAGKKYQLQYNSNLNSTNWTDLGDAIKAASGTLTATDVMRSNSCRFYRIMQLP